MVMSTEDDVYRMLDILDPPEGDPLRNVSFAERSRFVQERFGDQYGPDSDTIAEASGHAALELVVDNTGDSDNSGSAGSTRWSHSRRVISLGGHDYGGEIGIHNPRAFETRAPGIRGGA